jgi:hypothetical protein
VTSPRVPEQRKADALRMLKERHADLWLASASPTGAVHLVPLSFAWDDTCVIVATETSALTTLNILGSGAARLGLGATRDVVMIDSTLESIEPVDEAPAAISDCYASQADWDPRLAKGTFVYLRLRPQRVQVWREADEIADRLVMRHGVWTV